jgi:hypothetical protein
VVAAVALEEEAARNAAAVAVVEVEAEALAEIVVDVGPSVDDEVAFVFAVVTRES